MCVFDRNFYDSSWKVRNRHLIHTQHSLSHTHKHIQWTDFSHLLYHFWLSTWGLSIPIGTHHYCCAVIFECVYLFGPVSFFRTLLFPSGAWISLISSNQPQFRMQACIYASAISIAFILFSGRFAFCRSTDIRMGEIEKLCLDGSACGLVQLNMRGINREELCKCRHSRCPLEWDPLDGRTIMHGFDQYKVCTLIVLLNIKVVDTVDQCSCNS